MWWTEEGPELSASGALELVNMLLAVAAGPALVIS